MEQLYDFFVSLPSVIVDLWNDVVQGMMTAFEAIFEFYGLLVNQNTVMQDMIDQISSGNTFDGINLITYIGAYRYLAGEVLFNYTYLLLIVGAGFMIYKLVVAMINFIKNVFMGGNVSSKIKLGKLFK